MALSPSPGSSKTVSYLSRKPLGSKRPQRRRRLSSSLISSSHLGEIPLANFDKFSLQLHLNKLAATRSKDRVLQMRAYLRDIFAEAVDQDFLTKDPARKVKVPTQLRETDTTSLTWDQLRSALDALTPRDRILLELDMTNALRPSELFALKWRCFDADSCAMSVSETVYKGNIRPWGKTRRACPSFTSRPRSQKTCGHGKQSAPIPHPKRSSSPTRQGASWTRTTTASVFPTRSLAT